MPPIVSDLRSPPRSQSPVDGKERPKDAAKRLRRLARHRRLGSLGLGIDPMTIRRLGSSGSVHSSSPEPSPWDTFEFALAEPNASNAFATLPTNQDRLWSPPPSHAHADAGATTQAPADWSWPVARDTQVPSPAANADTVDPQLLREPPRSKPAARRNRVHFQPAAQAAAAALPLLSPARYCTPPPVLRALPTPDPSPEQPVWQRTDRRAQYHAAPAAAPAQPQPPDIWPGHSLPPPVPRQTQLSSSLPVYPETMPVYAEAERADTGAEPAYVGAERSFAGAGPAHAAVQPAYAGAGPTYPGPAPATAAAPAWHHGVAPQLPAAPLDLCFRPLPLTCLFAPAFYLPKQNLSAAEKRQEAQDLQAIHQLRFFCAPWPRQNQGAPDLAWAELPNHFVGAAEEARQLREALDRRSYWGMPQTWEQGWLAPKPGLELWIHTPGKDLAAAASWPSLDRTWAQADHIRRPPPAFYAQATVPIAPRGRTTLDPLSPSARALQARRRPDYSALLRHLESWE